MAQRRAQAPRGWYVPGAMRTLVAVATVACTGLALAVAPSAAQRAAPVDDARPVPASGKVGADCTLAGKKLYGRVKVVDHFADLKVKVVEHFADLHVQFVEHFPDACGKWQLVDSFPDFTITYVDSFPDLEITKVQHFPGRP